MNDVAHGELGDLARERAWYVRHRDDLRRHMALSCVVTDRTADFFLQALVELRARPEADEEHDAHVIVPVLADSEPFSDLGWAFDCRIDLRCADACATRVQH